MKYYNVIFANHGAIHTNCYKFYPNGKMKFENTVDAHIPSTEEIKVLIKSTQKI